MAGKAVMVLALLSVAACGGSSSGVTTRNTAPSLVVAIDPATGREIYTTSKEAYGQKKFFSAENLRETNFSGNTNPRLANAGETGPNGYIDTSRLNLGPTARARSDVGFDGQLIPYDPVIEPLERRPIVGQPFNVQTQNGRDVSLNFVNEPIPSVIQNVLGGILGVNFIVGDSVQGNITFRSEERFSRADLVQILADILARNGYLIQYLNGVYHIGTADELEQLATARGESRLQSDQTYSFSVDSPNLSGLVDLVAALLPPGMTIAQVPEQNKLVLQGDPTQFKSVENLVRTLVDTGIARQSVAIVPVREAPPEAIVEQLLALYDSRGISSVTAIPMEERQAVLIAANSNSQIAELKRFIREFDVDRRDRATLRVIQLTHLNAGATAERLAEIFAGGSIPTPGEVLNDGGSVLTASADDLASGGIRAPAALRGNQQGTATDATDGSAGGQTRGTTAAAEISVVADPQNNAIIVRSTYAEFIRIQEVVAALDRPLAQVVIEATIIEVDINDQLQYGVQAFLQSAGVTVRSSQGAGGVADPGGQGFTALLGAGGNVQVLLTALQSVTNVKVISSPYLTVVNGATSRLAVGTQIPFTTASQTSNNNGTVTVTQEVEARDVGVILEVTPDIGPDNSVLLDIAQEVSSTLTANTVAGQNPIISKREINSQVNVDSGSTVLLGGLITERADQTEGGVPVLRKVPVVGNLFNTVDNRQARSELIILITPRVVRNTDSLSKLTQQLRWHSATR